MDTDLKRAEASVEANLETAGVLAPLTSEEDSTAELKAMYQNQRNFGSCKSGGTAGGTPGAI